MTILLKEGQKAPEGYDVTIQPLNLEKLFVSLCGMEVDMAESRIIKRNVLFWGKSGLRLVSIMLIFMVVYGFLFNMGSDSIFGDFWKTAYFYGGIISVLFALIGSISYVGAYLPMALSFGSGRREAVFGAQIFCIAYGVSSYIIMVLAGIMSSGKLDGKLDVLIAVLFIFMTAVGQLVSVAQMHFGIKGMIHRNRHCGIMHGRRICDRNWIHR